MRPRPALRSVFPRLLPLVWILAAGGAAADAPPRSQVTAEDWRADLTLLLEELEAVHPDPWFHASRAEVVAEADELRERLPDLTWEESFAGLHRIVAMLRDGHTSFPLHRNEALGLRRVQVQYRLFGDELRVVRVHPDHAEVLGGRVTRIGDVDADEAIRRMAELVPADNDWTVRDRLPHYLTVADLLVGTGVLAGADACPVVVERGGERIAATLATAGEHHEDGWPDAIEGETPLYLSQPERNYFLEPLPERDAAYLHFRRVENEEDESFEDFCARAFAYLDEHAVERLVVDLRLNGGGNNYLNRPLIHGIIRNDRVNRPGHLWVITGRRTFSAAMCGTIDLERQTEALFAGEPTGASPNHHGDSVPIPLPRTGVTMRISALLWQNSDPRDRRPWLEPDLPVEVTWEDWVAGRDPVLEAVLSDQGGERTGLAEVMRGWLEEGASVDEAIARYHELRESAEATRYDFGEHQLNAVGYELLGQERFDEALKLFRLNVVEHETAWNPWDSLGEALVTAGRTEEAVEAYARSVELNPASRTGQAALRRLRRELAAGGAEGTR